MLGGEHGVFEAGVLGGFEPFVGIVLLGIELLRDRPIFVGRNAVGLPFRLQSPSRMMRSRSAGSVMGCAAERTAGNHRPGNVRGSDGRQSPMDE